MSSDNVVVDASVVEETLSETSSTREKKMNDKQRTCVMYCVWIMQHLKENNISLDDITPRDYIKTVFPILSDEQNTPEEQFNFFTDFEKKLKKENTKRALAAQARAAEKAAEKAEREAAKQAAKAEREAAKQAAKAAAQAAKKAEKATAKQKVAKEADDLMAKVENAEEAKAPRRGGAAKKKLVNTKANLIDELCAAESAPEPEPEPETKPAKKAAAPRKKAAKSDSETETTEPKPEPEPAKKAAAPRKKAAKAETEPAAKKTATRKKAPEPEPEPEPQPAEEEETQVVKGNMYEPWEFEGKSYLKHKESNEVIVMIDEAKKECEYIGVYDPETNTIVDDELDEE